MFEWRAWRAAAVRATGWFRTARADRRLAEELESHLQLHVDDGVRRGLAPDEARRRAVLALGGLEATKEACRDRRGFPMMDSLLRDVRFGARTLAKAPGFTLAAVVILGLGVGANAAMFSVVNAVALRPFDFAAPDRVVRVWHVPPPALFPGVTRFSVSPANYLDWQAQNDVFERMTIQGGRRINLTGRGEPDALPAAAVSLDYFPVFGVTPALGRFFQAGEDQAGSDGVIVLSDDLWRTRFGADRSIVGESIMVDGAPRTVIGVAPRVMNFVTQSRAWLPLVWTPEERQVRGNHNYIVTARLKAGVSVARAQNELTAISGRLAKQYPVDDAGWGAVVVPFQDAIVGDARTALFVLLGAVGFVMLIACANIGNLLLAKTLGRGKEIAVRTALGASRWRVIQQILCETMVLGLLGGAAGLLLARASVSGIIALLHDVPRAGEIDVDGRVLAFTALVAALTGIVAGVAPAWRLTRGNLHDALKQGLSRTGRQAADRRVRHVLVVSEVALALVLLVGAGLLIRTVATLRSSDAGIDPHNLLTMTVSLPRTKYADIAAQLRVFERALERIRALPGVRSASAIDSLPLQGGSMQPVAIEGQPVKPMAEQPEVAVRAVMPDYFGTIGTRFITGRDMTAGDRAGRQPVAVISESMARHFWPGDNPVGKHFTLTFEGTVSREVIGIVGDAKLHPLDMAATADAIYVPALQYPYPPQSLVVRTTVPPESLAAPVTSVIHDIDADQPVIDVMTMEDVVDSSLAQQRFAMQLLGAFAALALLLAAVGIYSVLSYTVRQQFRDIGIRMALGAPASGVLRMVVVEGMKPTIVGVAVGLLAAAGLGRVVATLVYGVSARDVATFCWVAAILSAVGLISTLVPAYRATRVDPLVALRDE